MPRVSFWAPTPHTYIKAYYLHRANEILIFRIDNEISSFRNYFYIYARISTLSNFNSFQILSASIVPPGYYPTCAEFVITGTDLLCLFLWNIILLSSLGVSALESMLSEPYLLSLLRLSGI